MARTYRRDSRGRFAGGGGGSSRPAARSVSRGTNRLTRDNAGRITSVGGNGATARGGRLRTASGKQRGVQTARVKAGGGAGRVAKPKGMKPQDSRKLRMGVALSRTRAANAKIADRPDLAQVNIKGRFRGQAGKRYDAGLDRAVRETKAAERAATIKPKAQVRQESKRLKSLRAAHESDIIAAIRKKNGKPAAEIRSFLRGRRPDQEIALIRNWVGEKRANTDLLAARRSRSAKPRRR